MADDNYKKKRFFARYGSEKHIPDVDRAMRGYDVMRGYDSVHILAASMENPVASHEHIMKGAEVNFYAVQDAAFRAYRDRFGESHPNDDSYAGADDDE